MQILKTCPQRIVIPPHTRRRIHERGGQVNDIAGRVRVACRAGAAGQVALVGDFPIIVVDIRAQTAIVETVLDWNMALKPGTQTQIV